MSISLLREVSDQVRPPRVLFVDAPLGYPLGAAHDAARQRAILCQALELLSQVAPLPIQAGYPSAPPAVD